MAHVQWLLEKLTQEINFFGPDVIPILYALKSAARNTIMLERVELSIELWLVFPADTSGDFIIFWLTHMTTARFDRKYERHLEYLKTRVLLDWFIDFCIQKYES